MSVHDIRDIERLKKINAALISRVERSMDQQGNAFSLFQTAINLENRIKQRTEELNAAMRRLEQTNLDLVAAKEAAERANLSKTRFLAAASHDVLQPLNAAHLSISALADLPATTESTRLVRQIERSLETMDELLRTLLDISKLDAGVVKAELRDVPISQIFQSLRSDFQPIADQKQVRLRFRPSLASARTDRSLLRRMLQNIVANALRYTQKGAVLVSVRRAAASDRIEVWDTGCGIAEEAREKIFEEFYRGVTVEEEGRSGGGLGLGLAIVQRMASALGYTVGFRSRVGRGAVFHIDMPPGTLTLIEASQEPLEVEPPRSYGLDGARVLLVENDADVLQAMADRLTAWTCDVRFATTAAEALRELNDTGWIPDIVIADQHLDDGDLGIQTIHDIREFVGRSVPALIVTADPNTALTSAARSMGVELMRKPVKPAQMRALLAHLLA